MEDNVRVRFAPSPTGDPHIGNVRVALYDYLFAKKNNGSYIVRLEDTDKAREVPGSEAKIRESLEWLGITSDESPWQGGEFGPYRQSERLDLYQKHAKELVAAGHAYHCFCTSERLEQVRAEQAKNHQPPRYDRHCRHLSADEVKQRLDAGEKFVIRLKVPDGQQIAFNDLVKGEIVFATDEIDDQILIKSDGFPTYHLAVVVDDHYMKISHIIRGEDWLSSTPKHLLLYKAFNWEVPFIAHLPLILGPDKAKLSKRNGHTSVLYYKINLGIHPGAMVNFMTHLGWTPKSEDQEFDLSDVGVSPAIFDMAKLEFLSREYISQEPIDTLLSVFVRWLDDDRREDDFRNHAVEKEYHAALKSDPEFAKAILEVLQVRSHSLSHMLLQELPVFFDQKPEPLTTELLTINGKIDVAKARQGLASVRQTIEALDNVMDFGINAVDRYKALQQHFKEHQPTDLDGRAYLHPARVAITRHAQSMNMFDFLAAYLLKSDGKAIVISRLEEAEKLLA